MILTDKLSATAWSAHGCSSAVVGGSMPTAECEGESF